MPAQIEARRAKIDCSRKKLANDGPNQKGQFINADEGVAYSSVYYLNIPINKRIPINMLATIISADHLLIYGKRSELINTRIVHFNQLLSVQVHISLPCAQSRRNGFATAM